MMPTQTPPIFYRSSGVTFTNLKYGNRLYSPSKGQLEHQKVAAMTYPQGDRLLLMPCYGSNIYEPTPHCFTMEHYNAYTVPGQTRQEYLVIERKVDSGNLVTLIQEGDFAQLKIYGTLADNTYTFVESDCGNAVVGPDAICGLVMAETSHG